MSGAQLAKSDSTTDNYHQKVHDFARFSMGVRASGSGAERVEIAMPLPEQEAYVGMCTLDVIHPHPEPLPIHPVTAL